MERLNITNIGNDQWNAMTDLNKNWIPAFFCSCLQTTKQTNQSAAGSVVWLHCKLLHCLNTCTCCVEALHCVKCRALDFWDYVDYVSEYTSQNWKQWAN